MGVKKTLFFCILILTTFLSLTSCNTGYEVNGRDVLYNYWNEGSGSNIIKIDEADYKSFEELEHSKYGKDQNFGYYEGNVINGIDPKTFKSITNYFAKDYKYAYFQKSIINGANGKKFELLNEGPYSRDGKDYFYDSIKLNVSDYKTFKLLDVFCGIDKSYIYIHSESSIKLYSNKYPLYDYKTFKLLEDGYAKDNQKVYYNGKVVEYANPKTFKIIDFGIGKDDNATYSRGEKE